MAPKGSQHQRTSSQGRKGAAPAHTSRPKLQHHHSSHDHHHVHHCHKRSHTALSMHSMGTGGGSLALQGPRKTVTEVVMLEDAGYDHDGLGSAGFLQFCTTCDKQIASPVGNILYCSEACRVKDAAGRSATDITLFAHSLPSRSPSTTILQPRVPTVLRPLSSAFSDTSGAEDASNEDGDEYSDDDFGAQEEVEEDGDDDNALCRQQTKRASTRADTLPSLSHTPCSSYGSATSERTLWPRRNALFSHGSSRSIDLVTPFYRNTAS